MTEILERPQAGKPGREAIAAATAAAAQRLAGQDRHGMTRPHVAEAFGRALAAAPPRSPHRALLAAALADRPQAERSPGELAARWLARRGETPTPEAVAGRLAAEVRQRARLEEARAIAERSGPAAAAYAAEVLERTGTGPTWRELARAQGWPERLASPVITRLAAAGWLATGTAPRSLRPGPRARR